MELIELKPGKALNKAFLKVKPNRTDIERFKSNLIHLLDTTNEKEREEFHKNLVSDFLKKTYYDPDYFINTKGDNDLVIHNGNKASTTVGVIIEAKSPANKSEMITTEKLNTKAFQEIVLYYLRERITLRNLEVKHLVITNINEWFIFDAVLFDRLFAQNKNLVKQFNDFEAGRLADVTTDFFYKQVAEVFIADIQQEITFVHFDLRNYQKPLRNKDKEDDKKLIALFKLLSPEHLLKLPFVNDSNSLDKKFYTELLHIIGLSEMKEGSKKLIGRNKEGERNSGAILEDTIIQLDSLDKLNRLEKPSHFGDTKEERFFNMALELCITWINRVLFLKLLEAQLINYHKGDKSYSFLNGDEIKSYDDLNSLFFQVLARRFDERNDDVKKPFEKVPYLNSSLFEPTDIEQVTLFISNLRDDKPIPIISSTVLKDAHGRKVTGKLTTLEYLFRFLDAYDFSGDGGEDIQEDNKTLINASVLGLIFEKINGYKDGSYFTPGFITMYMCRETIRKAVVEKFKEYSLNHDFPGYKITRIEDVSNLIPKYISRKKANEIVNSLKICDPAVGSGHFLVSALNEIIAIKNDLKILEDKEGKSLHWYEVTVENDELAVTDQDGDLFQYHPGNKESQRVQETLFHEKETIIENCLFGVDINPNSVKICRLRLWIELLKNAYYKASPSPSKGGELETLPNIDINIKCGNSLVSRFGIDADLKQALKKSKWTIESYKVAVATYQNAESKEEKREMEQLILSIKQSITTEIRMNDPIKKRLDKVAAELYHRFTGTFLFESPGEYNKKEKEQEKQRKREQEKLEREVESLTAKMEEIKNNKIYENSFEWRFEFPEVLNDEGDFVGFDVVIGNPPYGVRATENEKEFYSRNYLTSNDIYSSFIELSKRISSLNASVSLIIPITWLTGANYFNTRKLLSDSFSLLKAINLPYDIFMDAYVDTGLYFFKRATVQSALVYEFNPKAKVENGMLNTVKFNTLNRKNWEKNENLKININAGSNPIFQKLDSILTKLDSCSVTARGILANKQDYQERPSEEKDKRVFVGTLDRYLIDEKYSYIEYGENLKEKPKSYDFFVGERILIRRIINRRFRIMATITDEEFICKKDIYILKITDSKIDYEYLLGLINSKLISYYKTKNSGSAKKDDFTQITLSDIRQLPVPEIKNNITDAISEKVADVLKKKKSSMNTTELENQIDQLIYQLYGLTDEEIKIIENDSK